MGIPFWRKGALARVNRPAITEKPVPNDVTAVYVDANSVFHTAARHLYEVNGRLDIQRPVDAKELCDLIIYCFETIINHYGPSEVVVISVDGVVPMTKIQQQKERRYESGVLLEEEGYNSTFITPGTNFMITLDEALTAWADSVQRSTVKLYKHVKKIVYSSHLDYGEGEHKIMQHMRQYPLKGTQVVYGNDSDLLLLALTLNTPGLYVCKDTVDLFDLVGRRIKTDKDDPVNIDELRLGLMAQLGEDKSKVDGFIFACTLLGNDFLPRSPLFANIADGISTLITLLAEMDDDVLSLNGLRQLFLSLTALESFQTPERRDLPANMHNLTRHVQKRHVFVNERMGIRYLTFRSPILDAVSAYEDPSNKDTVFPILWYAKMFPLVTLVSTAVGSACLEYIRGLYWVSSYYREGQHSMTWLWYYPHHYAPLLSDISRVLEYLTLDEFQSLTKVSPSPGERKFTPLHQMLAVMPWQSRRFVPASLVEAFYNASSTVIDMMPITVVVDLELTEAAHQGKVLVPFARHYDIMYYVSEQDFPPTMLASLSYKGPLTRTHLPPPGARRVAQRVEIPAMQRETKSEEQLEVRDPKSVPAALERGLAVEARGRGARGRGGGRGDRGGDISRGGRGGDRGGVPRGGGRGGFEPFRGGQKTFYRTEGKDIVRR